MRRCFGSEEDLTGGPSAYYVEYNNTNLLFEEQRKQQIHQFSLLQIEICYIDFTMIPHYISQKKTLTKVVRLSCRHPSLYPRNLNLHFHIKSKELKK